MDKVILNKVSRAGELLIQAAATLGTLTPAQQEKLRIATDGALPDGIVFALRGAKSVSTQVSESLKSHPPQGLQGVTL
jgi:hypothetical protein